MPDGNLYRKARVGESFFFSAGLQNQLVDLAKAANRGGSPGQPPLRAASLAYGVIVNVLNTSAHAYSAFAPIHLGDVVVKDDDDPLSFQTVPALKVRTDVGSSACRGHWGICLDEIPAATTIEVDEETKSLYRAGRVLLSGVTVARVIKRESDDLFVDTGGDEEPPEDGDLDYLLSTRGVGAASILWIDPEAEAGEETWAVIQCHGYRVSDLEYWGTLQDDLYDEADATHSTALVTLQDSPREVRAGCKKLQLATHYLPTGTTVLVRPDAITGLWDVRDAIIPCMPEQEEEE